MFIVISIILILISLNLPKAKKPQAHLGLKALLKQANVLYVDKFSEKYLESLHKIISTEFDNAAKIRNEKISPNQKLKILAEIVMTIGMHGENFGLRHLAYELDRFKRYGIREDNKGLI